jgi:hypothetical protein
MTALAEEREAGFALVQGNRAVHEACSSAMAEDKEGGSIRPYL